MTTDPHEAVLKALHNNATEIDVAQAELDRLRAERLGLFHQGRALDPPLSNPKMAKAAGVTEQAVIKARRRAR